MKGLSSIERVILECIGNKSVTFEHVIHQTGLHENICFNVLQALLIRGILQSSEGRFKTSENISALILAEINSSEAKKFECLELMEALVEQKLNKAFRFQKIAMDEKDERIFLAMLSNLESFLGEAHKKAEKITPMKDRRIIFWGVAEVHTLLNQLIRG
jgi:cyanate lyase